MSGNTTAGGASIEYSSAPVTHHHGGGGGMMGGGGGMDSSFNNYHYNNNNNMSSTSIIPPPMNTANSQYQYGNGQGWLQFCCECYDYKKEYLEYDYALVDEKNTGNPSAPPQQQQQQAHPRIRARGEYYIDSYNDQPWSWTFGTAEKVSKKKDDESKAKGLSLSLFIAKSIYSRVSFFIHF